LALGTDVGRADGIDDGVLIGTAVGSADGINDGYSLETADGSADGTDDGMLLGPVVGLADGINTCGVGFCVGAQVGDEHIPPGREILAEGSVTITDITLLTLCRAATTARLNAAAVRVAYK
jgi:hypothetical protein